LRNSDRSCEFGMGLSSMQTAISGCKHKRAKLRIAVFCAALIALPISANAEGALAVGNPPDVSHQGFAYGIAVGSPDEKAASSKALDACHTTTEAPLSARNLCALVSTFDHKCASIAMDPAAGTPGVGWAIAPTQAEADRQALDNCRVTAGEDRKKACKVVDGHCDGL
jgi:hypothetical protein